MPKPVTHNATVNITKSGSASSVDPDPLIVEAGDTIIWEPVGGTINSFSFKDNKVFSKKPKKEEDAENWKAITDKKSKAKNDTYTVNVTTDDNITFDIDPELTVHQGG